MRRTIIIVIAIVTALAMSGSVFAATGATKGITMAKAKSIALKNAKVKKSKVIRLKAEYDADDKVYEVDFTKKKNRTKFEYEISASKGTILKKSVDLKYKKKFSKKKIGKMAAKKKAAKFLKINKKFVNKGTCKYEYDDGQGFYEIKFRKGKLMYEVEVQAPTGKVTEWQYKRIR